MLLINIFFFFQSHYYAKLDDIRIEVNAMMERKVWNTHAFPELKDNLLNILNIHDE